MLIPQSCFNAYYDGGPVLFSELEYVIHSVLLISDDMSAMISIIACWTCSEPVLYTTADILVNLLNLMYPLILF